MNKTCTNYKKYFSIRKNNFFEDLNIPLMQILKLLLCYLSRMPRYSIANYFHYNRKTIKKVISKIVRMIPDPYFSSNKMVGVSKILQVDKNMLNYKVGCHRGRFAKNKTDALCIIEF
ncbi:hypothetical protein DMUE_4548 [Dictyocoela muelleri]|nr:hypothetical protein DMUE_4548 [Dictyocoela muelleri]